VVAIYEKDGQSYIEVGLEYITPIYIAEVGFVVGGGPLHLDPLEVIPEDVFLHDLHTVEKTALRGMLLMEEIPTILEVITLREERSRPSARWPSPALPRMRRKSPGTFLTCPWCPPCSPGGCPSLSLSIYWVMSTLIEPTSN
jgi:hypothetical protein